MVATFNHYNYILHVYSGERLGLHIVLYRLYLRSTPDGYPHRRLLPMADGAGWLEGISRTRLRLWPWLQNFLGYLFLCEM